MNYNELSDLSVYIGEIKHMPKDVAKAFMLDKLPRFCIYPQEFLSSNSFNQIGYSFSASELHRPLEYAFGKADGMVQGKYKRARFFGFEYKDLYICAATETGDRGSSWYMMDKKTIDEIFKNKKFPDVNGYELLSARYVTKEQQALLFVDKLQEFFQFMNANIIHSLIHLKENGSLPASKLATFDDISENSWLQVCTTSGAKMYIAGLEQQLLNKISITAPSENENQIRKFKPL